MDSTTKNVVDLAASCACGNTQIAVHGRVLTTMLCACTECQRATGSGHSVIAMVPSDAIKITGDTRSFTRKADSGAQISRHFCPKCATTLYSTRNVSPEISLLPVGIFPKTEWYHPRQIIFNKSRTHWDNLPDDIPAYDTYRET